MQTKALVAEGKAKGFEHDTTAEVEAHIQMLEDSANSAGTTLKNYISFVIFNAGSTAQMLLDLQNMFLPGSVANGMDSSVLVGAECLYYVKSYSWILMIGIIGATNFPKRVVAGLRKQVTAEKVLVVLEPIALLFILLLSTAYLIDGSFNPFLYFRF